MRALRVLWTFARVSFEADPWLATLVLALSLADYATMALYAFGARELTNAALAGDAGRAGLAVALLVGGFVVQYLCLSAAFVYQQRLREATQLALDTRLAALTAGVPTLEHLERPDYLREVELLGQEHGFLADVHSALMWNVSTVARLAIAVGLLMVVDPLLLLLPLFGLPAIAHGVWSQRRRQRMREGLAERARLSEQLRLIATSAAGGREMRVFGLGDELLRRFGELRDQDQRVEDREGLVVAAVGTGAWAVFGLGFGAATWLLAQQALAGQTSLGDLVMALTVTTQLGTLLLTIVMLGSWLTDTVRSAGRYLWLLDYAADAGRAAATARQPAPATLANGIALEGVWFRYPGAEADVLAGLDLHLPAGSTVAIVGENGAGKTTLVKLLCRFYAPTAGRIVVDGADLSAIEVEAWRTRLSAGFQDFARLELAAAETIGVGDLPRIDDRPAIERALARAGGEDLPTELPAGLDTQLGRSFAGGAELSGGQWQKLALGRGFMREGPLLVVLDEPAASLDAATEHALFERQAVAARRIAVANGGITVLVSHRFSTVRMADLIVVLAGGRAIEQGTHDALMQAGGTYAELYELQARAYR